MIRVLVCFSALAMPATLSAEELKLRPLASGSIAELKKVDADPKTPSADELRAFCPTDGVISKSADLERLCKAWSIDVPQVDFTKELVIVGTWKGSSFSAQATLTDGVLQVRFSGTKDLRPGFRYLLAACPSGGIKSIGGKSGRK